MRIQPSVKKCFPQLTYGCELTQMAISKLDQAFEIHSLLVRFLRFRCPKRCRYLYVFIKMQPPRTRTGCGCHQFSWLRKWVWEMNPFCSIFNFRAATPDIQNLTSDTFRKCTYLDLKLCSFSGPHFLSLSYDLAMGPMGPWDNGSFLSAAAKRDFCQREPPSQGC